MSSIPSLSLARVSTLQWANQTTQQVDGIQQQLLTSEQQLSTGKQINVPSDNPGNANIVMQLQKSLDANTAYNTNLSAANSQLSEVDTTLGSVTNLIQKAQNIASADVSSDVDQTTRNSDAQVIQSLSTQALTLANTNFNGSFIFGGDKDTTAPYVSTPNGVQFVGSTTLLSNAAADNTQQLFQTNATNVFGTYSTNIAGTENLTPTISANTRIIDVNGANGDGVHLGTIQISNGTTSALVNLSGADTIGDVINDINNAAVGNITASIDAAGNGITLSTTGTDNITVKDMGGSSAAADLGIAQSTGGGPGVSVVGNSVEPKVTDLTPLSALRGGAGLDTSGLIITNGSKSATISLSSATTVQDVLNDINGAGVGVQASINSAGTGINIVNTVQGSEMTIAENGGTTAAELGVRTFGPSTALADLNDGQGVNSVAGGDFQITNTAGTAFNVSLTGAKTVQDVINAINTAGAGDGVTASFSTTGNGIVLSDTAGGSGKLNVTQINNSTAAADLGLTTPASSSATSIVGADVGTVGTPGLFTDLSALTTALQSGNQTAITAAAQSLQSDYNSVVAARGANGAQLQSISAFQDNITDENTATTTLISSLQDTNYTTAVTQYDTLQQSLEASLETAARTLQLSLLDYLT
jgi:flagellin-like hook-associated protein FlgL